ncbi:piggyBac transposable element-derived protein 3-like [Artemia franciscana]
MFDDDMVERLVFQSNLYAMQKEGVQLKVTNKEMGQFLGIHMLMGIIKQPTMSQHWNRATRFPLIADVMPRDRFKTLRRFFHANDNHLAVPKGQDGYDSLFKLRPVIDGLRANLTKIPAEERQSIDEQMVPFKGKLRFKQYLKDKPHSWGIKIFSRAGASGIIYDFEVYTGKGSVPVTELGQGAEVVLRLAEEIPRDKNFKLFFDNYYTSIPLIRELLLHGIHSAGTVRTNRLKGCNIEADDLLKKKGRGSFDYRVETNSGIVVTKWFDNKSVCIASSFVGAEPSDNCKRWDRNSKKYVDVVRPLCIAEYNKFMGGVDLSDMLIELYRIDIRGKKWYMRLFYYFLDLSVVNAWLLYRRHMGQQGRTHNKSLLDFKSEIANYLTSTNDGTPKPRGRPLRDQDCSTPKRPKLAKPKPYDSVRYDGIQHWPEAVADKKRCRLCSAYARIQCFKCHVSLCLVKNRNCFKIFHTQ